MRIALRGAIGGFDHTVLTWLALDRPFPFDDLVDVLIAIIAGSVDGLVSLDPAIELRDDRIESGWVFEDYRGELFKGKGNV